MAQRTASVRSASAAVVAAIVAVLTLGALPATAADNGSKHAPLPIDIHSNNARFDKKTDRSVYDGSVKLTRGGLTLTGDKLVVTHTQHQGRLHAVLTGKPAHIHKKPDQAGGHHVIGHADTITLDKPTHHVILHGNAYLRRADGNAISGQTIVHNTETGRNTASRGHQKKRVHVTLHPKKHKSNNPKPNNNTSNGSQ